MLNEIFWNHQLRIVGCSLPQVGPEQGPETGESLEINLGSWLFRWLGMLLMPHWDKHRHKHT